jgi:hypothetical protein
VLAEEGDGFLRAARPLVVEGGGDHLVVLPAAASTAFTMLW